jgi:hypothetical protein
LQQPGSQLDFGNLTKARPETSRRVLSFLTMDPVIAYLQRIESKLDTLIAALAEDEPDEPVLDLEGRPTGQPRDLDQPL